MSEQTHDKDIFEQYIADVDAGRVVANEYVKKTVRRHIDDLAHGHERGLYFDRDEAIWVCNSFPALFKHTSGEFAGQPFHLTPWQACIVALVFGWKYKATGLRRFRRVYVEVARRNGKSTLLAAIALFMLLMDGEPAAQIYSAATKRDQAKIVWNEAKRMVRGNRTLSEAINIYRESLAVPASDSTFLPLSSDSKSLDGLNIHAAVVDELHAHPTPEVWQVLDSATGSRTQPLICIITTAGFNQNGICFEIRSMVIDILNKVIDNDSWFGFVAGLDEKDVYSDESVWEKANPNLRYIGTLLPDLREKALRAGRSANEMNNFLVKCMCRWTTQATRWLKLEDWDKCKVKTPFTYDAMRGRPAFAGLDLAEKLDLTAACLCFPPTVDGERFRYLWKFFLPEDTVERYSQHGDMRWKQWVLSGELTVTPGARTDYAVVREQLNQWAQDFELKLCAFDPMWATQLAGQLIDDGIEMVEIRQNPVGMTEGSKEFESQLVAHLIEHNGGSLMRWQVDNVALESTGDGKCKPVRPQKNRNARKIDGVVAAVMACGAAVRAPIEAPVSFEMFTL